MACSYIQTQIAAVQRTVRNCQESCRQSVRDSGATTTPQEVKRMAALTVATERFLKDLERIK